MKAVSLLVLLAAMAIAGCRGADVTYPQLAAANCTKQFRLALSTTAKTSDKSLFLPHNCSNMAIGAACNQPPLSPSRDDKLRVRFEYTGTTGLQTLQGLSPTNVALRLCFSKASFNDRPWRKFSNVTTKDKSCPTTIAKFPFNNTEELETSMYEATLSLAQHTELPSATWYVQMLINCGNTTASGNTTVVCAFENSNAASSAPAKSSTGATTLSTTTNSTSTTANTTSTNSTTSPQYVETESINAVPASLVTAIAIASAVGPLFLVGFFIVESIRSRKAQK